MSNEDRELETFLYQIISEISKTDAPIVFKGGLALKDLLYKINPDQKIERRTVDIDANWTDKVNPEKIYKVLENAVKKVEPSYKIKYSRMAGENRSMGFEILDNEDIIVAKIDLDIKDNPFYVICEVNDVNIKYSSIEKMLADKLFALSGPRVFRRGKDILDVYLIISDNKINLDKVLEILEYDNRKLDNFKTMLDNKEVMQKAYDSLKGITNKPDFEEVWDKVMNYLVENKLFEKNKKLLKDN